MQKIKQIQADFLLLTITVIWGLSLILMKNTLQHISAFCYLSVRFTVAAIVLTVIYRKKIKLINAASTKNSLIIGFFLFAGITSQVVALNYTKASNAALIKGGKDNQVEIWGSRIELGEIETILLSHPLIKEAVVNIYANKNENIYLCAYIHAEPKLTGSMVRNYLVQRFPNYMIPKHLFFLDKMLFTSHVKIDHQSLPESNQSNTIKTDYIKPRTKLEEHLAMLWSKVLPYTKISVKDDFFLLGGDSLAAMHLLELAGDLFSIEELIQFPTIEALAREIQSNKVTKSALENSSELL